jgi:hypothetical protein
MMIFSLASTRLPPCDHSAQWIHELASPVANNKAFLSGDLYLTNNGISIYAAAKNEKKDIAA